MVISMLCILLNYLIILFNSISMNPKKLYYNNYMYKVPLDMGREDVPTRGTDWFVYL